MRQEGTSLSECIIYARDNLDLLPSKNIEQINAELYRETKIDTVLKEKLKELENFSYDYVIIDCGPQRSKINDAVLYYVDGIIVPVQVDKRIILMLSLSALLSFV